MELPLPEPRFFVERLPAAGQSVRLAAREAAHARARRWSPEDSVLLVDGSGRQARARLRRLPRGGVEAVVENLLETADSWAALSLYAAGVRAERLSWIAEKATELGVTRVTLLQTERTQSFRASEALRERLERVCRAAAKQSGAPRWPEILGPVPAAEALARESSAHRLLLDPEGGTFPHSLPAGSAAIAVGPEGGWSASERASARERGWNVVSLPAGRLRAETAVVAGLILLRAALSSMPPRA